MTRGAADSSRWCEKCRTWGNHHTDRHPVQLPGHGLAFEGAPHHDDGTRDVDSLYPSSRGVGRGKCSCGVLSEVLPSGYARKKWHREHKAEVAAPGRGREGKMK